MLSGFVAEAVRLDSIADTLADVDVCVLDSGPCTTTNKNGGYSLLVPADAEFAVTYSQPGFTPTLVPWRSCVDDVEGFVGAVFLPSDARAARWAEILQTPRPPEGTGSLLVTTWTSLMADSAGARSGITYTLNDSAAKGFYVLDDVPDASLTETQGAGSGGFVEVEPGVVLLEVGGNATNCTTPQAWETGTDNLFAVPIHEGFSTQINIACDRTQ